MGQQTLSVDSNNKTYDLTFDRSEYVYMATITVNSEDFSCNQRTKKKRFFIHFEFEVHSSIQNK